jgi:LacI family transcriptional regulator
LELQHGSVPYFYTNNQAIATFAADHLLDRGFKHFAFCGYARSPINGWSQEREEAFVKCVKKRATSCAVFQDLERLKDIRDALNWAALQRSLAEWLRTLPRPLGVMAANVPVVRRCS